MTQKKREILENPKFEEIQEKRCIDRNWTITTCLLRDGNPNCQCLKITSCRWRPPPRMNAFTATTNFKSSRYLCHPVCVACSAECDSVAFCRACNTHTQDDTKERELFKYIVAEKECICGGGRHLQDVIFKHWQYGLLSLKRQVVMVQFLSMNFFLGFLQFLLGFSKVHVFCITLYYTNLKHLYSLL